MAVVWFFSLCSVQLLSCSVDSETKWLEQRTSQGYFYYYNPESKEGHWERPADFRSSALLTREEIQVSGAN